MPATIILYNQISASGAETTGTWVRISASGPTAPVLYNDSIDFTGQPAGDYIYEYTVTDSVATHKSRVTVRWAGTTPARTYVTCATGYYINSGADPPYTFVVADDSRYQCGVQGLSATSEAPLPGTWTYGSYSGDLWYFFVAKGKSQLHHITFKVDGSVYGTEGVYSPAIEVFTYLASSNCTTKVTQANQASSTGQQVVTTNIFLPADNTYRIVAFRVSSVSGKEGKFDITIEGFCPP
jgi:hypothetical protein